MFKDNEVDPKTSFNFFKCSNIKVTIPGKIKSFLLHGCKSVELSTDSCISQGEVIKSEKIKIIVNEIVPQISIELSNQVEVGATHEFKDKISLVTTAS